MSPKRDSLAEYSGESVQRICSWMDAGTACCGAGWFTSIDHVGRLWSKVQHLKLENPVSPCSGKDQAGVFGAACKIQSGFVWITSLPG